MRKRILAFSRRPFIRNVATIAGGAVAAQAITMAFSPINTRLFGPEAYGIQGLFLSIAGFLATMAALSYPIAIVLPKNDADAIGLGRVSLCLGVLLSVMVTIVLFFYGHEILAFLNAEELTSLMYLLPVAMLISVVSAVVSQWLIRKQAFSFTARATAAQALLVNTIKAGLGFVHPTAAGLILVNTFGGLFTAALMMLGCRGVAPGGKAEVNTSRPVSRAWAIAKQHRDFPLLRTPQALLNAASQSLPIALLAAYFGPHSVGFYAIASSVLAVPAGLIGGSVMQVFYPRVSEAVLRGENARTLIVKATLGLALAGVLPVVAVIATGPALFELVFGSEWRMAGVYAQWLSPWLFFQCINKPAVSAIPALGLQGGLLVYEVFSSGTKILALYIGYMVYANDIVAIALYSVFGIISYIWLILWVIYHSNRPVFNTPHNEF